MGLSLRLRAVRARPVIAIPDMAVQRSFARRRQCHAASLNYMCIEYAISSRCSLTARTIIEHCHFAPTNATRERVPL
jgi:hypothetical protein